MTFFPYIDCSLNDRQEGGVQELGVAFITQKGQQHSIGKEMRYLFQYASSHSSNLSIHSNKVRTSTDASATLPFQVPKQRGESAEYRILLCAGKHLDTYHPIFMIFRIFH